MPIGVAPSQAPPAPGGPLTRVQAVPQRGPDDMERRREIIRAPGKSRTHAGER